MAFRSMISKSLQQFRDKTANNGGTVSPNNMIMIETDGVSGSPLSAMANSFEELSAIVRGGAGNDDLRLKPFCDACCHVSTLFGCLGIAFKFAEMEYTGKVRDLTQAAQSYGTLNSILDSDLRNDRVRTQGSMSRNLRRVRQGLDLIRALFINFLSSDDFSLKEAASTAYAKVCAPYHTWAVRTAVSAGMCALPTREQLLLKLNETEESAEKQMRRYIEASLPIIQYVDKLYISRNIDLDW